MTIGVSKNPNLPDCWLAGRSDSTTEQNGDWKRSGGGQNLGTDLIALGDGDDALGGEPAGDGRAADRAETGLAEGAARLDARPGHYADEAEVVRAAVELAADGLPRLRQADAAGPDLRRGLDVHLGLSFCDRRAAPVAVAGERGGHVVCGGRCVGGSGRDDFSLLRRRLYFG